MVAGIYGPQRQTVRDRSRIGWNAQKIASVNAHMMNETELLISGEKTDCGSRG